VPIGSLFVDAETTDCSFHINGKIMEVRAWRLLEATLKTKMHGRNVSTLYPNYTKLFYLPMYL